MIATNARRVSSNTDPEINTWIWQQTESRMRDIASRGRHAIQQRLHELDEEWDVERYVETLAPSLTLVGITLGLARDRRWFVLPFLVQGFFLQHALQGWCPPVPVLRRLGVRTMQEIERERCGLAHHLATLCDEQPCLEEASVGGRH